MSSGALSVALSDRPTAPNTLSTSGKERRIRSCSCKSCEACVIEMPGSAVGMYSEEPSNKGGINWLASLNIKGKVNTRNDKLSSNVVFRNLKQSRRTGK